LIEVLIVDDEASIREMLSVHFDLAKYSFREAANGEEALDRLNEHVSDVVVLDLMMPVMDGMETCRRIRENPRTALTYVIMLTAKDSVDDRVSGLDMGADAYITKPFEPRELMAQVRVGIRAFWERQSTLMDPLTNLFNGRAFNAFLDMEIERAGRHEHPLSMALARIGNLTEINEKHGQVTGDRVLAKLAEQLSADSRRGDLVSHWGSGRFAWLMPENDETAANVAVKRLIKAVKALDLGISDPLDLGIVTLALTDGEGPSDFVRRAENKLSMAY